MARLADFGKRSSKRLLYPGTCRNANSHKSAFAVIDRIRIDFRPRPTAATRGARNISFLMAGVSCLAVIHFTYAYQNRIAAAEGAKVGLELIILVADFIARTDMPEKLLRRSMMLEYLSQVPNSHHFLLCLSDSINALRSCSVSSDISRSINLPKSLS